MVRLGQDGTMFISVARFANVPSRDKSGQMSAWADLSRPLSVGNRLFRLGTRTRQSIHLVCNSQSFIQFMAVEKTMTNLQKLRLPLAVATISLSFVLGSSVALGQAVLEEVVVTAQKREQSLQDVPLSINAVSGEMIEDAGMDDLTDLSSFVPNLVISRSAVNTEIRIRGIGSSINRGFEQSVGMYIDGIYMGRGRQYRSPFLDLERVEVLRGPQGILFGKNTIAGAVSVISRSPEAGAATSGSVSLNYEPEYNTQALVGALETGLGDNAGIRLAAKYASSDGYVKNVTVGRDEPQTEELSLRGTLAWNVSDSVDANLKVSYSTFDVEGSNANHKLFTFVDDPLSGFDGIAFALVANGLADPTFNANGDLYDAWRNNGGPGSSRTVFTPDFGKYPDQNETETLTTALTFNWDLEGGTLTSVTGLSSYETSDGVDADFLPIQLLDRSDDHDFDQFSQEFRFSSQDNERFNYMVGAYFEKQDLDMTGRIELDGTIGDLVPIVLGGAPTLFINGVVSLNNPALAHPVLYRTGSFTQDTENISVFAEGTFDFTETLRVSLGLRYSDEQKDVHKSLYLSAVSLDLVGGGVLNGADIPLDPTDVASGGLDVEAIWSAAFGTVNHDIRGSRSEDHVSPAVKLMWDSSDSTMWYASYSEGFKSGGFNSTDDLPFDLVTGEPLGFSYEDESAKSFEIGFKSELAGGRVRWNGAVFSTDYDDLQVAAFTGTSFTVGNAASAEIKGVEMDVEWAATENLVVGGNIAYLDHEYKDYATAGCTAPQIAQLSGVYLGALQAGTPGDSIGAASGLCSITSVPAMPISAVGLPNRPVTVQNLTGQRGEYAPEWSGSVFARHEMAIGDNLYLSTNLDVNWSQEFFMDADLDPGTLQDSYALVNLRFGLSDADDSWEVFIYGRNLTDEDVYGAALDTPLVTGAMTGYLLDPMVYGIGGKFSF